MADRLTTAFLRQVARAAAKNAEMQGRLTDAMVGRYGCTHSDIDCDELIDRLDYGLGDAPTLAEADAAMLECGVKPRDRNDDEGSA